MVVGGLFVFLLASCLYNNSLQILGQIQLLKSSPSNRHYLTVLQNFVMKQWGEDLQVPHLEVACTPLDVFVRSFGKNRGQRKAKEVLATLI